MRCALTVAGSDSCGGAGIQADVKAMASIGVHAACVITAVTAQNTREVASILPIDEEFVKIQLDTVLKDMDIKAVKTGMLYNPEIVETVADVLEDHDMPLIVDPVMVATVGDALSTTDMSRSLKRELLPICELVTPNKDEAEILAKMKIRNEDDAMLACELIGKEGSSVLLKGGHMSGKTVIDYLYLSSEFTKIEKPRLRASGHGSGCTLSSYITAYMANGTDIVNSVLQSRELIQESLASAYAIGKGVKAVNPMVKMHNESARFSVLDAVDAAAVDIVGMIPEKMVPEAGINIAYSMPDPAGPEDIAAVERRIAVHNGIVRKNGSAKFGAAEQLSYILLATLKTDPKSRSIMNIALRNDILEVMEEVGFVIAEMDRRSDRSVADATIEAIASVGSTPDAIVDSGKGKGERSIRILGTDPEDVVAKLESIL